MKRKIDFPEKKTVITKPFSPGSRLTGNTKKTTATQGHSYAFLLFSGIFFYGLVIVCRCAFPQVRGVTYYFHAVDFSLGFCSKFLPGAVYNLFVRTPSPLSATIYEGILLTAFFLVVALFLKRLLLSVPVRERGGLCLLLAFYLTGPATFAPYVYKLGMLDVYWLFLSALFLFLLRFSKARILLPVLFGVACMIHYGAMLTYVPFFALLLFYELLRAEKGRGRRVLVAVLIAGLMISAGTFFYFSVFEKDNVRVEIEDFNRIVEERGVENPFYYDYALYGGGKIDDARFKRESGVEAYYPEAPAVLLFPEYQDLLPVKILNVFAYQIQLHVYFYTHQTIVKRTFIQFVLLNLLLAPLLALFYSVFGRKFRAAKGKRAERLLYFSLMSLYPVSAYGVLLVSTDSTRWTYHVFLILFTFLLYLIFREKEQILPRIRQFCARIPRPAVFLYFVLYFFTILDPYV